jgi:hypothetical protein
VRERERDNTPRHGLRYEVGSGQEARQVQYGALATQVMVRRVGEQLDESIGKTDTWKDKEINYK